MSNFKPFDLVWDNEKIKRLWDFYSQTYPFNEVYFTKTFGKDILKKTISKVGKLKNKIIVDFGCGPAFILYHMLNNKIYFKKYIGVDFSPETIKSNKEKYGNFRNCEFINISGLPTNIPDNLADICFLIEVIEHLDDKDLEMTLKEIWRILKPDGYIVITTPNEEDLELSKCFCPNCGAIYHRWQHIRSWNKITLTDTMLSFKFKPFYLKTLDFIPDENLILKVFVSLKSFLKPLFKKKKNNLFGIFKKCVA